MEFSELPEFLHDLKRLKKKYSSLDEDISLLKEVLRRFPQGRGEKHWNCLHREEKISVFKTRLACRYLRADKMRVIYAQHSEQAKIVFIELYYKGEKENEDRERIKQYLKSIS